jgi:hypothetical protein
MLSNKLVKSLSLMSVASSSFMDALETVKKPGLPRKKFSGLETFSPKMFHLLAFLHGDSVQNTFSTGPIRR